MIGVVVVDDEALVRSGSSLVLGAAEDIAVLATADGPGAVSTVRDLRPDVVLLDIRMPVAEVLTTGASGSLLEDTDPERLPGLVRTLAPGDRP